MLIRLRLLIQNVTQVFWPKKVMWPMPQRMMIIILTCSSSSMEIALSLDSRPSGLLLDSITCVIMIFTHGLIIFTLMVTIYCCVIQHLQKPDSMIVYAWVCVWDDNHILCNSENTPPSVPPQIPHCWSAVTSRKHAFSQDGWVERRRDIVIWLEHKNYRTLWLL